MPLGDSTHVELLKGLCSAYGLKQMPNDNRDTQNIYKQTTKKFKENHTTETEEPKKDME